MSHGEDQAAARLPGDLPPPSHALARAIMLAVAAALGGFLFGYDTSVINGAVDALKSEFHLNSVVAGLVVSSALLGCAVGAWFAGPMADRYGRVRVMLVAAILFLVSAIGSALAFSPIELTGWRVIGGSAVGAASVIAPAYIAEIAPARLRGRLGSLQQLAIVVGIFAALLVDYVITRVSGGASSEFPAGGAAWRWMFASAAIPAVLYGVVSLAIPESPRYLVKKKQYAKARKVLVELDEGSMGMQVGDVGPSSPERQPSAQE